MTCGMTIALPAHNTNVMSVGAGMTGRMQELAAARNIELERKLATHIVAHSKFPLNQFCIMAHKTLFLKTEAKNSMAKIGTRGYVSAMPREYG